MKIGLFVPCYIDQFYPEVAVATLEILESLDFVEKVFYPKEQTCCGQPMANSGCNADLPNLANRFVNQFKHADYIVCPSGSCVAMVRMQYRNYLETSALPMLRATLELSEFLVDIANYECGDTKFPYRVGLHQSCHGLRELGLGQSSERNGIAFNKPRSLLQQLRGIELVELQRSDECCGFGGTFAVDEEAVSCMMGVDRIADHQQAQAEIITAVDMSCLMHLDGIISRKSLQLPVMHIAEILAGRVPKSLVPDQGACDGN
ncbi:MAG: (Fe-S)-binding protein [Planctomycetaceae bacterium]|nr:(Fe-S)-binding protein [Planctomycetaceae bacterium]